MKKDYATCLQIAYNFSTNAIKIFYSGNNAIFE